MDAVQRFLLECPNPYDVPTAALNDLAERLSRAVPDASFELFERPERGYGVSPFEVIRLWCEIADGGVSTAVILKTATTFMRERWRADKARHREEGARPIAFEVVNVGDGQVNLTVQIDAATGRVVELRGDGLDRNPRPLPPGDVLRRGGIGSDAPS